MSPSGCHGHQRSTSLLHGQVAPLGLQVFPHETPTVEQAVLGMHVWVRGSEWVHDSDGVVDRGKTATS